MMEHSRINSNTDKTSHFNILEQRGSIIPRNFLKPLRLLDFPPVRRPSNVQWEQQSELLGRALDASERMQESKRKFYARPPRERERDQTNERRQF